MEMCWSVKHISERARLRLLCLSSGGLISRELFQSEDCSIAPKLLEIGVANLSWTAIHVDCFEKS